MSEQPVAVARPRTLAWRALRLRCARCGAPHIMADWFHLRERCPGCGWEFERVEGAFLGSYLINLYLILVVLFVVCFTFLLVKNAWPSTSEVPALVIALVAAVVVPVAAYPFSKAGWVAIEVGLGGHDLMAEIEAALAAERSADDRPDDRTDDRTDGQGREPAGADSPPEPPEPSGGR